MHFSNEKDKNELSGNVELTKRSQTNIRRSCLSWTFFCPLFRNGTIGESLKVENLKNPMLLSPVIRCILKFLNIENIKNCRLVCREWGSNGKIALGSRAQIYFYDPLLPADFRSCFLDSSFLFSVFKISGYLCTESINDSWSIEELTKFFEKQKHLKELTLDLRYPNKYIEKINTPVLGYQNPQPWRSLTKLKIEGDWRLPKPLVILPLDFISHIEDLNLSQCRINLEAGIMICPIKLKLENVKIFQNGIELSRVRINDFVDFRKTRQVSLDCSSFVTENFTKCVLDLLGNTTLERLALKNGEIVNGERSQWAIEQLSTVEIPYSLNSQMNIKELYLSGAGTLDLSTFPDTIQKLAINGINNRNIIICRKQIFLENLQYLYIREYPGCDTDFSYLSHFRNCPQLTHLKLHLQNEKEMNSLWMPKSVKTLTLEKAIINWTDDSYLNLEKLLFPFLLTVDEARTLFQAKIQVQDVIMRHKSMALNKYLVALLEIRNRFSFGKRLYVGELDWEKEKLKNSILKKYVDVKSSFYMFENEEKGSALSREAFYANVPKHLDIITCHIRWWLDEAFQIPI